MGMSNEINGNNCYLSQTPLQLSNCGETLLLSQNPIEGMPRLVSGVNTLNAFNTTFNSLNQSVIINANDLSNETQQIILVSSPMDLMAVPQQPLLSKAVPQSTGALQMVLQTNELPLISSATQLNVIEVPTNLLLTENNLIVIPQEGLTLEVPALGTVPSHQAIDNHLTYDNKSQTTIVYNGSPQLLATGQQISYNPNVDQLVVNLNDCFTVNNKSIDSTLNANQYFPANNQIIGIIENTNETKLLATEQTLFADDLNAFLANTMASNAEPEFDPNEAKSWLNDSLIAYRAMAAFKKVMPNDMPSPTSGIRVHK